MQQDGDQSRVTSVKVQILVEICRDLTESILSLFGEVLQLEKLGKNNGEIVF